MKYLIVLSLLLLSTIPSWAQLNRSQMNSYNNAFITANGIGSITGTILNTDIANVINGLASLSDANTFTNSMTLGTITGFTQCLHVNTLGQISGTGTDCGSSGGTVASISNSDGTLTISPTTGIIVASLALGHANTWTGVQTLASPVFTGTPIAPTPAFGTNTTQLTTMAA